MSDANILGLQKKERKRFKIKKKLNCDVRKIIGKKTKTELNKYVSQILEENLETSKYNIINNHNFKTKATKIDSTLHDTRERDDSITIKKLKQENKKNVPVLTLNSKSNVFIVQNSKDDESSLKSTKEGYVKKKRSKDSIIQEEYSKLKANKKEELPKKKRKSFDGKEIKHVVDYNSRKLKKKKRKSSASPSQTLQNSNEKKRVEGSAKKKKHIDRDFQEESHSKSVDKKEKPKKEMEKDNTDEYYPGMLSELLQIKKYGRLIIPWDPSFGLDPNYKIPEGDRQGLTINPLFDLSKYNNKDLPPVKDNSETNIFVGNLPNDINIKKLKQLFRKCGTIQYARLRIKELKQGKSGADKKGAEENKVINASIRFSSFESCERALKMNGKVYEGHHLKVVLPKDEEAPDSTKCIFIGNLSFNAQDDDLWKAFENCGAIDSVRVVRDSRNGKGKGFGFVNFKYADSVEEAVKVDGTMILGRAIRVERNERHPTSLSNSDIVKRRKKKKKSLVLGEEAVENGKTTAPINSGDSNKKHKKKKKKRHKEVIACAISDEV